MLEQTLACVLNCFYQIQRKLSLTMMNLLKTFVTKLSTHKELLQLIQVLPATKISLIFNNLTSDFNQQLHQMNYFEDLLNSDLTTEKLTVLMQNFPTLTAKVHANLGAVLQSSTPDSMARKYLLIQFDKQLLSILKSSQPNQRDALITLLNDTTSPVYHLAARWPIMLAAIEQLNSQEMDDWINTLAKQENTGPSKLKQVLQHGNNLIKLLKLKTINNDKINAQTLLAQPGMLDLIAHFEHLRKLTKISPEAMLACLKQGKTSLIETPEQLAVLFANLPNSENQIELSNLVSNHHAYKKIFGFGQRHPILRDALIVLTVALVAAIVVCTLSYFSVTAATFFGVSSFLPTLTPTLTLSAKATVLAKFAGIVGGFFVGGITVLGALITTLVHTINPTKLLISEIASNELEAPARKKLEQAVQLPNNINNHTDASTYLDTYVELDGAFTTLNDLDNHLKTRVCNQIYKAQAIAKHHSKELTHCNHTSICKNKIWQ